MRRAYLGSLLSELERFFDQFRWWEVELTSEVRKLAASQIATYNVRAHDAVHLASASYMSISDFVGLDETYRTVDGLVLWNDLIHAGKPVRGSR